MTKLRVSPIQIMTPTNPNIENPMNDGYLSQDRDYINKGQRQRRATLKRIDYMPSKQAEAIINGKRGRYYPMNIVSGVIDAIVTEWASDRNLIEPNRKPYESGKRPELSYPIRAHANDFGDLLRTKLAALNANRRVICGAKTRSGKPCRAKSLPSKNRCKWHGGCSTGPKTSEGKAKSLANLKQYAQSKNR